MSDQHDILIKELIKLLEGGGAHATLEDALNSIPADKLGIKPHGIPYSIWQLAEHIRIAQWDMLEFSKDASHQSPKWPDDYWPKEAAPADEATWNKTLEAIKADRKAFIELLRSGDIYAAIPHGDGQSILREALQIADHNAYHTSEIILLRRLLGIWK
ncbi:MULTISPECIES: DinB family protein [unclassified Mucilaginibacter]|uniref:DinB family protein n=1 Tax=unclassified Mucilaginibacter TaxID=2617802 RepID=UPI00095F227C|nr:MULTISPECIES: DinB family protein [unclassified Mucilaginibacter]OJW13778.1 MAG: ABC transporter [Mucilaginibacter sp. 44-25]PLW91482.1 MAG: ABC transporter [Mucilaginibacter sp.]HEK21460.1 DinB family protein [Bacteroidota bacterium]